jgi:hypothetical protein
MSCDTKDFRFPMQADIYYPIIEQSPYGNTSKTWTYDKTVPCNFVPAGINYKEELNINIEILKDSIMIGRVKSDIRSSSFGEQFGLLNILITNIKDKNCNELYIETDGPRAGMPTLFEIATFQPFVNPFGGIDYYKVVIRRSENQGFDV